MTQKTFSGSCHCGHVRFEADIDLDDGTGKCSCSFCTKMRFRGAIVKPAAFRLLAGQAVLVDYRFDSESVHHPFCRYCGAHSFAHGQLDAVGGEFFSVNLACLDDAGIAEFADASECCPEERAYYRFNAAAEARHL